MIRRFAVLLAAALTVVGCGSDGRDGPGFATAADVVVAEHQFSIPLGTAAATDAGTLVEVMPEVVTVKVGETIEIINRDVRGHSVGPWYIGVGESVRQSFTSPGEYIGDCTVNQSRSLVLIVEPA